MRNNRATNGVDTDMKILVTGASGLIGSALVPSLGAHGHSVVRAVRRPARDGEVQWNPADGILDPAHLAGVDAVVHLAGAGIGDKRWSDSYKREILESRTKSTDLLARSIAAAENGPKVFLSGSAIGIYGPRGDEELPENASHGDGFLADVCRQWEEASGPAEQAGARVVHLRTGIVLSPKGGALKKQLPLFRLGLGGRFGNGRQWQSWISIDDEVGAITHLLGSSLSGAVNLVAPQPVTNAEFTRVLARVLSRPALFPVPSFGPRLLLGGELADALLFTGQRVVPQALVSDGYRFAHPDLETALRALLKK
ncbi:MAG: hypothetical protein RLY50_306 [Actinomycetota bacterium]